MSCNCIEITLRIGEIDVDLQSRSQRLVARHLFALIVGQRLSHARWDMRNLRVKASRMASAVQSRSLVISR